MGSNGKSTGYLFNFRTKFLAVFMAMILAFSMFDLTAFAEMTEQGNAEEIAPTSAIEDQDASITLDLEDSYLEVNGQTVTGSTVVVPTNVDLSFAAHANTDFILSDVKAQSATFGEVPLVKVDDKYTISKVYLDSSLKIEVTTEADQASAKETSEATPLDEGEGSDDEEEGDAPAEESAAADTPEDLSVGTQSTDETTPLGEVGTQDASDLESQGTKSVQLLPKESFSGNTITKLTGDSLSALLTLTSDELDGVIVAIPRNPNVEVTLTNKPPVDGVLGTYVSRQTLEATSGISLNPDYDEYFVLASNRMSSKGNPVTQFIDVAFTFKEGTTPDGEYQPIEAYVIDGVQDPAHEIVPGTTIAISSNATADKYPASGDPVKMVSEVESLSIEKSKVTITGGTDDPSTALDNRNFKDEGGLYTIEYSLTLKSDRPDTATGNQGRLMIDGDFVIHDELTNLLVGKNSEDERIGQPSQITITGNGVNKTISAAEIAAAVGENGSSFPFSFNAKQSPETGGFVDLASYTVTVTYNKDDYTDFYETSAQEITARQKITNSAWIVAKTQATYVDSTGGTKNIMIDTSADKSSVDNYIGYKQLAPNDLSLEIQKLVRIKDVSTPYGPAMQLKYPEDFEDKTKVVTFTLRPKGSTGDEGVLGGGVNGSGAINGSGLAVITGLVPGTTYLLEETQAIENFYSVGWDTTSSSYKPVEVVVGPSVNGVSTIMIDGVDYYGGTYQAVNQAKYDGTIVATVEMQENDLTKPTTVGTYYKATTDEVEVTLYAKGIDDDGAETLTPISTVKTDSLGQVKFENLDTTLEYVVKAKDDKSELKPNDVTTSVTGSSDTNVSIKYTSTYGALKIGKKFIGADGNAVSNSNLKATFTLKNNDPLAVPQTYTFVVGSSQTALLYNQKIAPGAYTLTEQSVSGTGSVEYEMAASEQVNVVNGEFDALDKVLVNNSTYGQLQIANFDFGNAELKVKKEGSTNRVFTYDVERKTEVEGTTVWVKETSVTLTNEEASKIINVPVGEYRVTSTGNPAGFEMIKSSETTTVVKQTAPENVTVAGSAPNFSFSGGVQTVGFVYGLMPNATGTKVDVRGESGAEGTIYKGLPNATFALYESSGSSSTYRRTVTSGADGLVSIKNLPAGTYYLIEISAPEGYALSLHAQALNNDAKNKNDLNTSFLLNMPMIVVSYAGDYTAYGSATSIAEAQKTVSVNTTGVTNSIGSDTSLIPNTPVVTPEIKMTSAGDDGKGSIEGATFVIYRKDGSNLVELGEATTTKAGFVTFVNGGPVELGEGTYVIKQTALDEDAETYVLRPNAEVTFIVNSKGEITSSTFTGDGDYANSKVEGSRITFSNAKKPSIKINKLGETNVFAPGTQDRVEKPLTGAEFEFTNKDTGNGLLIDKDNNLIGEGSPATTQTTYRGGTQVNHLDPEATYSIEETYAPGIEDTELGRQIETSIPDVAFELVEKDGEYVGYRIVGQGDRTDPTTNTTVTIKDSTLSIHDPAEATYQIQVTKFGMGTDNGVLDIMVPDPNDPSAKIRNPDVSGPYEDGVNAKFEIQKKDEDTGEWTTVEVITTGTDSIANDAALNKALSSGLTKGTYRIVEIQSGIYAPSLSEGNSLYINAGGATGDLTAWEKIEDPNLVLRDKSGNVVGLIWPGEIVLGPQGSGADHSDPTTPYNVNIGNDDERSNGSPWLPDYVVRLHGMKLSIDQDLDQSSPTGTVESTTGEVEKVEFEVYFGWATLNADNAYELVEKDLTKLQKLSNVVSGSVKGEKGGFITEYVTFKEWTGGTDYDDAQTQPSNAVPCFVLVEQGPVPAHLVQPTEDTKTVLLPFSIPSMDTSSANATSKESYMTIDSEDILPLGSNGMSDYSNSNGAVVKNYEAEGSLQINKYSSTQLNVKKKEDREKIDEGLYYVYPVIEEVIDGTKVKTVSSIPSAVIDLASGTNEVELLKGEYVIKEINAPEGYNKSGWYRINNGGKTEFPGQTRYVDIPESEEPVVLDIYNAPYATLHLENYWDSDKKDGEEATYTISYTAPLLIDAYTFAQYPHTTQNGAAETSPLTVTVKDKDTLTLYNLLDGEYLIKETSIKGGDAYNKNAQASGNGVKVIIKNGRVAKANSLTNSQGGLLVTDPADLLWRAANGFDDKNTTNATKDNIDRADALEIDDSEDNDDKIQVTTVKVNHLSKSYLAINMRYIDSVGVMQNSAGSMTGTLFTVKKLTGEVVEEAVIWNSGTKKIPLDEGIYQVQQQTKYIDPNTGIPTLYPTSSNTLTYTADVTTAYVYISPTGQVTYLQNNTADKDANKNAIGALSTDTKEGALQPGAESAVKYFYNKIDAGKLVIIKTDDKQTNPAQLPGAAFTVSGTGYSQNATASNSAPGTTGAGTHYIKDVPAAPGGGTAYTVKETTTPTGYYVDGSEVPVTVKPNQVTEVSVKNIPFTSLSVHKTAKTVAYIDENGDQQEGTTHDVYGLDVKIYKDGSTTLYGSTATTDREGMLTFTNLDAGTYRVEEQTNLSYLDVEGPSGNKQYNSTNTAGHFTVTYTASPDNGQRKVEVSTAGNVEANVDDTTGHITIEILNNYKDGSIFIPVKKLDAKTDKGVEGAQFRLVGENGEPLYEATARATLTVVTNAKGVAYFHFMPEEVFDSVTGSNPYTGKYYIKEIDATSYYVISPYESEYLKEATSKTDPATQKVSYDTIIFKNEPAETEPTLGVEKSVDASPSAPLTQLEGGFNATYTITPEVAYAKDNAGKLLGNQVVNYTVTDKGLAFKDAQGNPIYDDRLTYTLDKLTITDASSGVVEGAAHKDLYVSVDAGQNWKKLENGNASFTLNKAGKATDPAASLFEVWYSEKSADGSFERIVNTGEDGFKSGTITVTATFDQFVMENDPATLSNEVAKIVNTVETKADYPSSTEVDGLVPLTPAEDTATIEMPELPTLSITKVTKPEDAEARRGKNLLYSVTLTNTSDKAVKNPTIIDMPTLVSAGGTAEEAMKVILDENNKPVLKTINGSDPSEYEYQSFAWNDGAVAAWVFKADLAPNSSLTIEYEVKLEDAILADTVTNVAYGTSLLKYDDVAATSSYYAKDNPTGALFKPQANPTAAEVATESEIQEIMKVTAGSLNGGVFVKASKQNTLESEQALKIEKRIKNEDSNSWSSAIDVKPGESYNYRLRVQWIAEGSSSDVTDVVIDETIPQFGVHGSEWNDDLTSRLTFEDLEVWGPKNGTYQKLDEIHPSGLGDYEIVYDSGDPTDFVSFKITMVSDFKLSPKDALTVTYKVNVPEVDESDFDYDMLEANARLDGNSRFDVSYFFSGFSQPALTSNKVTAHLVAPETDLVGTVWDDQNRNGELEDEEGTPAYKRDTLDEEDVTVVLHKQTFDDNGVGTWEEDPATARVSDDGTYEFTGLESSHGKNGPLYKVEFVYEQGDATYERPRTHVFSDGSSAGFENDGSTTGVSNVVNKGTNNTTTALVGDSDEIKLLHGTVSTKYGAANVVNAGINAIPFTVSYDYGSAPAGASTLPSDEIYIYEDGVSVQPDASAPGYTFIGWDTQDVVDFGENTVGYWMPPNNVAMTGVWSARGDTSYIVEYYFQNIGGKGYTKNENETRHYTGKTDTTVTAPIPGFTGFTHNPTAPGTLLSDNLNGDGSTVLKVYYDRKQYDVNYVYAGSVPQGAPQLPATVSYWYGDTVSIAKIPTLVGYTFNGWSHTEAFTMPAKNVTISGSWVAKGDTPYRVEYYLQNIGGGGYTQDKAATYYGSGKTDTTVNALIKAYQGFTHNRNAAGSLLSDTLRGNGSTVLKVYYDRNQYTVNYVYTGTVPDGAPTPPASATYWYGQPVTVAGAPSLTGYRFSGWSTTDSFSMPANNVTIRGSWTRNGTTVVTPPPTTTPEDPKPTIVPVANNGGDPVDAITSMVDPIGKTMDELSTILETTIDDGETPLAGGHGIWCWVHWYILLGIVITALYSAVVIVRRRKFVNALNDLEKEVMGEEEEKGASSYGTPAPSGMGV